MMEKFFKSFSHAWKGYLNFLSSERNARIESLIAVFTIVAGFILAISPVQWLILLFCIGLVLSLEMINTSIEIFCDVVSPRFHPGIKRVKDIAAGSVLIASFISLAIGLIIFIPKVTELVLKIKI